MLLQRLQYLFRVDVQAGLALRRYGHVRILFELFGERLGRRRLVVLGVLLARVVEYVVRVGGLFRVWLVDECLKKKK